MADLGLHPQVVDLVKAAPLGGKRTRMSTDLSLSTGDIRSPSARW